ncbi:MAG: Hpt domain-containing protein [Burkholderiaceae bacterium]
MSASALPAAAPQVTNTPGMSVLYQRFCQRLPERVATLQNGWGRWQVSSDEKAPDELVRALHSLAGAAGLHGLDELTHRARALEQTLLAPDARPAAQASAFEALIACLNGLAMSP